MAGAGDDDIDSDGDWAGLAAGDDAGDLLGDAGFGDLAEDAYSGALAGVASGGADGGVERERSKLDGREGCMWGCLGGEKTGGKQRIRVDGQFLCAWVGRWWHERYEERDYKRTGQGWEVWGFNNCNLTSWIIKRLKKKKKVEQTGNKLI